jgi:tRNA(adenine34) deaminase
MFMDDERFMLAAIAEAEAAFEDGDVPVGAVIVHDNRIIARGRNQRELLNDPTAHAEMIALTAAASRLQSWRLDDCTMHVTLEPCPMCAGAIVLARLPRLVFGAVDPKTGACVSLFNIPSDARLNHRVAISQSTLADSCADLLRQFFERKRSARRK